MKRKILVLIILFLGLSISCAFASWDKRPQLQWLEYYRYDFRHEHDQLYANRISLAFSYFGSQENPLFKISPFYEARRNVHTDLWERQELGAEIGKDIFPWCYVGEAIQQVILKEAYRQYPANKERDATESETRFMLHHYLLDKERIKLKGFLLDEYTYDFRRGAGTRNEVSIGLIMPIGKYIETGIDWRHIDRLHDFDSDTFEASLTLIY